MALSVSLRHFKLLSKHWKQKNGFKKERTMMRKTLKKKITQVTVCLLKWREVILTVRKLGRKLLHKTGSGENLETFFFCSCTVSSIPHTETRDTVKTHQVMSSAQTCQWASILLSVKAKVLSVAGNAPTQSFFPSLPTSCCAPHGHSAPATLCP